MTESKSKDRLVNLLDRKVFRPILRASPDRYSGRDREKLEHVQEATRSTRRSYRREYGSAEKVYEMFRNDLSSEPARRVSRESRQLGLPTFEDVEEEFGEVARDVGVRDRSGGGSD